MENYITPDSFMYAMAFALGACVLSFAWAPILTNFLYKYKIIKGAKFELAGMQHADIKANTPVMGGLLVIVSVALITLIFNWDRSFTWVPIGVMLLAAILGGVDDLLNVYGIERRSRKISQIMKLIRIHKEWKMRLWYILTLPWNIFKRMSVWIGSRSSSGVQVHEKLILQFAAGAIAAWWIYSKLGPAWHNIYVPFYGDIVLGWLIIPLIILVVMFTANAVNIADGMDGLAGGMLIPTFGALAFLSWIGGFNEMAFLNATAMGSLIAYTYFNIKPARFHMGDVGSLGLGALLAINALVIGHMVTLVFIAFMFYIEAGSVIIQLFGKAFLGKRIFRMAPIHHHFEIIGWSEEKTIMRFWIVHLFFVIVGIWAGLH